MITTRDEKGRFVCGVSASPGTQFKKGQHWRKRKPYWDRAWLENEYVNKKRTLSEIAAEFGVTANAISFWIIKHGIKTRSISETRKIKYWGASGKANPMYGRRGPKSTYWKGGHTPQRQKDYAKTEVISFLRSIRQRDRVCQRCGSKGSSPLHVHPIQSFSLYPELRYVESNCVCLCKACHLWVHSNANERGDFLKP